MTLDPKAVAALALHRFGLGPTRHAIAAIAGDPRGALLAELDRPGAGQVAAAHLPNSGQAARSLFEFRAEQQAKLRLAERARKAATAANPSAMVTQELATPPPAAGQPGAEPPLPRQLVLN